MGTGAVHVSIIFILNQLLQFVFNQLTELFKT
jgi:hypothetical protein